MPFLPLLPPPPPPPPTGLRTDLGPDATGEDSDGAAVTTEDGLEMTSMSEEVAFVSSSSPVSEVAPLVGKDLETTS